MITQQHIQFQAFVQSAQRHAQAVLLQADRQFAHAHPLLADGIHQATCEAVEWRQHGKIWLLSNFASQQNFMRVLLGISRMTGDAMYANRAHAIATTVFKTQRHGDMIWWGAHCSVNLADKCLVFCNDGSVHPRHELKNCFPYYELLNAVDGEQTRKVIEGIWEMHLRDWSCLSFNRHAVFSANRYKHIRKTRKVSSMWDEPYTGKSFTSEYFTFLPAGADLIYSATQLAHFQQDERPMVWALRLLEKYIDTANPHIDLPQYLYNASYRPANTQKGTAERFDRAHSQLSEQLGRPVEERMVWTPVQINKVMFSMIAFLHLHRTTQQKLFLDLPVRWLKAFAMHSFDFQTGMFHPVLSDGTTLNNLRLEREGYFGAKGQVLIAQQANAQALVAFCLGFVLSNDDILWRVCCRLARLFDLGDIETHANTNLQVNFATACADPMVLLAMVALAQSSKRDDLRMLAIAIGQNILAQQHPSGLFVKPNRSYARTDALEPLALLHLANFLADGAYDVPAWTGGRGEFQAHFDGMGRCTDGALFYD